MLEPISLIDPRPSDHAEISNGHPMNNNAVEERSEA
jgi:hypothetical protein